jgi:hypothetical protein
VFCTQCGNEHIGGARFCNQCGAPAEQKLNPTIRVSSTFEQFRNLPSIETQVGESHGSLSSVGLDANVSEKVDVYPPYERFAIPYFFALVSAAAVLLIVTEHLGGKHWNDNIVMVVAVSALIIFGLMSMKHWRAVKVGLNPIRDRANFASLRKGLSFASLTILFFVAIAGYMLGESREAQRKFNEDLAKYSELGERISDRRSQVSENIPSWISMYQAIEPDVIELKSLIPNMKSEFVAYGKRYPHLKFIEKSVQNVAVTGERMVLLERQIAIAKRLELLDSETQSEIWKSEMLPVLQEEDKLDAKQ